METLNNLEKITLLISMSIVALINLSIIVNKIKMKVTMKRFTKLSLVTILFMSSFSMKSQDTIYLKDKTVISAKIIEVGISEIKYLRVDNLNGPNYLSSKSDIFLIKYSNGVIDSINEKIVESIILNSKTREITLDNISVTGRKLTYNGVTLSDIGLSNLIDKCENPEKRALLKAEYKKMKRYKTNQRLYPPLIFATSFVILIGTSPLVTSPENFSSMGYSQETMQVAAAGILGAALTRITGFVVNKVNQNKRWNKRNEIAFLYNDFK